MQIEVKETHPPKAANRSGTVVAIDGQKFDCWPNLMRNIHVGRRYEIETTTNDRGYTSITKAVPIHDAAPVAAIAPAAAPSFGEAEFAGRVLAALIAKGIDDGKLAAYTARLRKIWRETDPDTVPYREAAE